MSVTRPQTSRWRATALTVAMSLVLGACAIAPASKAPPEAAKAENLGLLPGPAWQGPQAQWWHQLGDAQLDDWVAAALSQQPSLAVAQSRIAQVDALYDDAKAQTRVQVQGEAQAMRQRFPEHSLYPPPLAGSWESTGTLKVGGKWALDLFGRERAQIEAAVGQQEAARLDLQQARNALSAQVVREYLRLARAVAQQQTWQERLKVRETQLALVAARRKAGLDTQIDVHQGEQGLSEIRLQLDQSREQAALSRHALEALSARPAGSASALSPSLEGLKRLALQPGLSADLLAHRADVQAAQARIRAATAQQAYARALFFPDISLSAFVGFESIGLDELLKGGSRMMGLGPALHLPLFESGRLKAYHAQQQAQLDAAVLQYNQQVLGVVREAADVGSSWQSVLGQEATQRQALDAAQAQHQLVQARAGRGIGGDLPVLQAKLQVLAQRAVWQDLQWRALDTQAQLAYVLGGGLPLQPSPSLAQAPGR